MSKEHSAIGLMNPDRQIVRRRHHYLNRQALLAQVVRFMTCSDSSDNRWFMSRGSTNQAGSCGCQPIDRIGIADRFVTSGGPTTMPVRTPGNPTWTD